MTHPSMHSTRALRRSRLVLGATLALLGACGARAPAQERVDRRHAAARDASIRITVISADATVRVVGWDRDSIVITGTISRGARFDGGVLPGGHGGKFFVESDMAAAGARQQLEVRVPAGARVWVKMGSGLIEASGVTGALDLNLVGGAIRVSGTPREVNAEAMDGDIDIGGAVAWLRAKSAGGRVTLHGGGEDVALSSVSGPVLVSGGRVVRGKFETVTGDIRFDAAVERSGALSFDSHSGAIELRLPASAAADIDVQSIAGTIVNELTSARVIPARDMRGRELGASVGGGGAHITIRSFKGSVALRRK